MTKRIAVILVAAAMLLGPAQAAHAALTAVQPGPYLAAYGFYPAWYQDSTGLQLELCLSEAVSPNVPAAVPPALPAFMCLLSAPDPTAPIIFPVNFGDENFWFTGDAIMNTSGLNMLLVTAVEAAFNTPEVIDGQQITFARVRIRIDVPSPGGTYTITHPYGISTFTAAPGIRSINDTVDVGIGAPGDYTGALAGPVGPFLHAASAPGGTPTPTVVGGVTFIGDPNIDQFVTGSPFATNFFRVEGPGINPDAAFPCDSSPAPTQPANCVETKVFSVSGMVFRGLATSVIVDRSTYSRALDGSSHVDVFATSPAGNTLSFRDTLTSLTSTPMVGDTTGKFYGQELNPAPIPAFVIVTASAPAGSNFPASLSSPVVDVVKITKAQYALDTLTLRVEATSSDQFAPPTLTTVGFGELTAGTLNAPLAQPPARVTVVSSQGGRDTEPVQIVPTFPVAANLAPVAVNDTATTPQRTAVNIAVLANDGDPDNNLPLTVANLTQPALGTGAVSLVGTTVTYTPPAVFAGTATFTYQAADSLGALSNVATVTVTVTNQPPVAVNDNATTTAGTAVNINLTANDSDPDGNTPLTVANLTQPAAGTGSVSPLGSTSATYTPPAGFTGTASFTYQARDTLGALSNVATVTVTVTNVVTVETISATAQASLNVGKGTASWTINGTTTVLTPTHTMTVRLTRTGAQIGAPATTDTKGRWKLVAAKSTIVPLAGDTITVTSSLGRTQTFPVTIK